MLCQLLTYVKFTNIFKQPPMVIRNSIFLKFNGEIDDDVFIGWLLEVEAVFYYKRYRDPKRVYLVETMLRKGTMHWWCNFQTSRDSRPSVYHLLA